jgi:hypothetical protein
VQRITHDQRRRRLAARHHLAAPAADPVQVARAVVALHATDPASVHVSVQARTGGLPVPAIESALYADRSLVRMLGIRRTMFVVPTDLVPVMQAAATDAVAVTQRRRYQQLIADGGGGDGAWLREVEADTLAVLTELGAATGAQLSTRVPALRTQVVVNPEKPYGGATSITTWVLLLLSADGHIVRGRPRGTWVSSQYEWAPTATWLPDEPAPWTRAEARAELVRRYLAAFGPATMADVQWWTGWSGRDTAAALRDVGPAEVALDDGGTGLVLAEDAGDVPDPGPSVALLPALDPTPMGWKHRDWFLGPHAVPLFDRSGNIGPTVWVDGRIVGGWGQRPDGGVAVRLLQDVGAAATAAVETERARLSDWFGGVRITPRFRTPLERELGA